MGQLVSNMRGALTATGKKNTGQPRMRMRRAVSVPDLIPDDLFYMHLDCTRVVKANEEQRRVKLKVR